MKRVLLVDDDPLILHLYKHGLSQLGFQVDTAADGFAAMQALQTTRPDVMVLDLMMPRFSGIEVLKALRAREDFASLPVIVLSNSYMDELARGATSQKVQKGLFKVRCNPHILAEVIHQTLEGKATDLEDSQLLAAPKKKPLAPQRLVPLPPPPAPSDSAPAQPEDLSPPQATEAAPAVTAFKVRARQDFLESARANRTALRHLCHDFLAAPTEREQFMRLAMFYRKVHYLAATAGMADCHDLAQMASVFEAFLFELDANPAFVTPSALQTVSAESDFLDTLFEHAHESDPAVPPAGRALVVDDEPLSVRLAVGALRQAHLQVEGAQSSEAALRLLQEKPFDLVLLDIEMPDMDGFELCRRLRALPNYQSVPVIYVTTHDDFESRAESVLSGGNDLISKPVLPMELAVKAVGHLLRSRLAGRRMPRDGGGME